MVRVEVVEEVSLSRSVENETRTDLAGSALSNATTLGRGKRNPMLFPPQSLATFSTASLGRISTRT